MQHGHSVSQQAVADRLSSESTATVIRPLKRRKACISSSLSGNLLKIPWLSCISPMEGTIIRAWFKGNQLNAVADSLCSWPSNWHKPQKCRKVVTVSVTPWLTYICLDAINAEEGRICFISAAMKKKAVEGVFWATQSLQLPKVIMSFMEDFPYIFIQRKIFQNNGNKSLKLTTRSKLRGSKEYQRWSMKDTR